MANRGGTSIQASARSAAAPRRKGAGSPMPGRWPALAMSAAFAAFSAFWTLPRLAAPQAPAAEGAPSALAEVAPAERNAALSTMHLSPGLAASLEKQDAGCKRLAWVSVARAPGTKGGTIRLLSGGYGSPVFTPTEIPLRVAIPYPAPYLSGHGTLTILSDAGGAIVALTPAWHAPLQAGRSSHEVSWIPDQACSKAAP